MKLFLIFSALFVLSSAHAQTDSSVICGPGLKASTPLFQNALDNLYSFGYVHHALEQVQQEEGPDVVFCTSSIALRKNIYMYFQHLIQIDVYPKNITAPTHRFRFLFQNASVQAFHNVGGQPWAGIGSAFADQTLKNLVDQAQWTSLPTLVGVENSKDIARLTSTFQKDAEKVDNDSFSAIPVSNGNGKQIFLATWLTKSGDNPFSSPIYTRGVLVAIATDKSVEVAENIFPEGDLLIPLENQLEKSGCSGRQISLDCEITGVE